MAEVEKIEETEELKEFKSDHSESEIADPVSKGSNKRPADKKDGGDKKADKLSRSEMLKDMMSRGSEMAYTDLADAHGKFTSVFDGDAVDNSKKNKATITTKEDMDALFGGNEQLTEEFKEKANIIFESAVNAKVIAETTRLEEEFEAKVEETIVERLEEIEDQVDEYLSAVVEQWMEDNALVIESSIKTDVMESFLTGLKDLFEEHYVEIPEDKVDAVDALAEQVEDLEEKLNEEIKRTVKLQKELSESRIEQATDGLFEGLTAPDQEKLEQLFEGIEFNSPEEFEKKATIIAENFLKNGVKKADADHLLTEEVDIHEEDKEQPVVDPAMSRYIGAVSRTTAKK
jgi:hypothetical protein